MGAERGWEEDRGGEEEGGEKWEVLAASKLSLGAKVWAKRSQVPGQTRSFNCHPATPQPAPAGLRAGM